MAQMCKPACAASYSETEKVSYNTGSQGCYSLEYQHQELKSGGFSMGHVGEHHMNESLLHQHSGHSSYGNKACHSSEYKRQEHNSGVNPMNQTGNHTGAGGMLHKHLNHNSHPTTGGHHSFTEKIAGCFSHAESSHGHAGSTHGHHGSAHGHVGSTQGHHGSAHGHHGSAHGSTYDTSCAYTQKEEEHMSYKSGQMKKEFRYEKKSSYEKEYKDGSDSSDSESDVEGCHKRC